MMKNLFKRGSQATATQGVPVKEATPRKTGLRSTIKASVAKAQQGASDLMMSVVPNKLRSSAASQDKEAAVLKVEVMAFDPATPNTTTKNTLKPNQALAEITNKVKVACSKEEAAPLAPAAPVATPPQLETPETVTPSPAAVPAPDLTQAEGDEAKNLTSAAADNPPAAADTNLTSSPADNHPAAADTAMIKNAPADNHPAAAAPSTKVSKLNLFPKFLTMELPAFDMIAFKPFDLNFPTIGFDFKLPSCMGRSHTTEETLDMTNTSPDPASRLEQFQAGLITKYGPLKINDWEEDMTTPGAPRNVAAAAAVVAATTNMEMENAVVTLVPQVDTAGAMTVAATPIVTQPAAAPKPVVRGAVGRKVHWAGKRLREVREGASACRKKIQKGAAKRVAKLQQALSRRSSKK